MIKNTGITFEKAIEEVFKMMYNAYPNATIRHDVKLDSPYGKRQFDVVIYFKIPDGELISVIEGKDYNKKVDIKIVDGFHSKMRDVNASKGLLISKMGFTSTAQAKAKQLGIGLYSLNKFSEFKEFDLKVPVLIEEIFPIKLDIFFRLDRVDFPNAPKIYFNRNEMIINNVNISNLVNEIWKDGSLQFDPNQKIQDLDIPGLSAPYVLKAFGHESLNIITEIKVTDVKLRLELGKKFYTSDIRELLTNNALKNIEKNSIQFFINNESITSAINNLTKVNPNYANEFTGMHYIIKIKNTATINYESGILSFKKT